MINLKKKMKDTERKLKKTNQTGPNATACIVKKKIIYCYLNYWYYCCLNYSGKILLNLHFKMYTISFLHLYENKPHY